jgi:hypothetical protein
MALEIKINYVNCLCNAEFVINNAVPLGITLTAYSHSIQHSNKMTVLNPLSN